MKKNNPKHNRKNKSLNLRNEYYGLLGGLSDIFDVSRTNNCEEMLPYNDIEDVKSFLWSFLLIKAFKCQKVDRNCYTHQITGPELCPEIMGKVPNDHILLADLDRGQFIHSALVELGLIEDWMVMSFPINLSDKGTNRHPFKLILGEQDGQKYFAVDEEKIENCTHIKPEFTDEDDIKNIKNNYYRMLN